MKISKKSKIKFLQYISYDLEDDGFSHTIVEAIIEDVKASDDTGSDEFEDELLDIIYGDEVDPKSLS